MDLLRYGENPHQRAAFYAAGRRRAGVLSQVRQHPRQGALVQQPARPRRRPAAGPPASPSRRRDPQAQQPLRRGGRAEPSAEAFELAYEGDPVSAFGGDRRRSTGRSTARRPSGWSPGRFIEAIIAPGFDARRARAPDDEPTWKNSVRLLDLRSADRPDCRPRGLRPAAGRGGPARPGLGRDGGRPGAPEQVATDAAADRASSGATCGSPGGSARRCKSNAIVLARGRQLVGVGAGQMSRLDSVRIAVEKAGDAGAGARCSPPTPSSRSATAPSRRRGGRHRDHPARRLEARRRDRRRLRRARHGHDPHRPPPLPALMALQPPRVRAPAGPTRTSSATAA